MRKCCSTIRWRSPPNSLSDPTRPAPKPQGVIHERPDHADRPHHPAAKPSYLSPEELSGEGELSPASDVFSLASLAYELLTGALPFQGDSLPMLLLHGDTHTHRVDRPLRDRAGRPIGHVTRVECFGTPRATRWLTVSVPASDPASFSVAARELESAQRP